MAIHSKTDDAAKNKDSVADVILPYNTADEYYIEPLGQLQKKYVYSFVKRAFDIIVSLLCMLVLLIPSCIIAIVIKAKSRGRVFYFQERLGKDGKKFNIVKFRTMYEDAELGGAQWCIDENDARITPVGRVLRKYYLDELPQLWCIFTGSMSIVGPRPERPCFYAQFETYIHGFSERLKVTPGLTGLAQINGDFRMKPEDKIKYDVEYIKKRSLWLDIKIIFKTFGVILVKLGKSK